MLIKERKEDKSQRIHGRGEGIEGDGRGGRNARCSCWEGRRSARRKKKKAEVSLWAKEDELQAVECWWRWRCTVLLSGDNVVVSVEVLW